MFQRIGQYEMKGYMSTVYTPLLPKLNLPSAPIVICPCVAEEIGST